MSQGTATTSPPAALPPKSPDAATLLAMGRTSMAAERTLMAWIRTSISMIGFGFTLAKFLEYLAHEKAAPIKGPFGATWASSTVGLTLVAIGTFSLIAAIIQYRQELAVLRAAGLPVRRSLSMVVGFNSRHSGRIRICGAGTTLVVSLSRC